MCTTENLCAMWLKLFFLECARWVVAFFVLLPGGSLIGRSPNFGYTRPCTKKESINAFEGASFLHLEELLKRCLPVQQDGGGRPCTDLSGRKRNEGESHDGGRHDGESEGGNPALDRLQGQTPRPPHLTRPPMTGTGPDDGRRWRSGRTRWTCLQSRMFGTDWRCVRPP